MANRRSLNRVILIGNCGKDPEIKHIPSLDKDVARFSIATTEVYMDKNTNQFSDLTEWHNIVAWGWNAKKVERSVTRGSLVLVEGRIKTRKWTDKNNQDRWSTEIHADTVTPLEKSNRDGAGYGGPPSGDENQSYGYDRQNDRGGGNYSSNQGSSQPQAPPEMQINDINDIPYDDSDPF